MVSFNLIIVTTVFSRTSLVNIIIKITASQNSSVRILHNWFKNIFIIFICIWSLLYLTFVFSFLPWLYCGKDFITEVVAVKLFCGILTDLSKVLESSSETLHLDIVVTKLVEDLVVYINTVRSDSFLRKIHAYVLEILLFLINEERWN